MSASAEPQGLAIAVEPHERLAARAFTTRFAEPLGAQPSPASLVRLLALECDAPLQRDEDARKAVRDMLRLGGYKPTGRGKPSSEYLVRAADPEGGGALGSINRAVDACNAVSLASGLPISVVDLAKARPPFRIALAAPGSSYAFNASGQEIDVGGLVCLFDAEGPCANAVKDCQRTKTDAETRETLSVIWGVAGHEQRGEAAERWYRHLLAMVGAETAVAELVPTG